ncbi:hypothetical protein V6U71_21435 [Sphingopyxis sp. J-6]|uniref:hypothetical protein n=1 Tax=Sphingopyxis sp. J-6 TaxID=3122054 RepID=UPI0039845E75
MTTAQNDYAARVRAAGAAYYTLTALNQRDYVALFAFEGGDYSSATFRGQVRSRPDADGDPLAEFTCTPELSGSDTVLTVTIAKADIVALPAAAEPGAASLLYYDITIEPDGGVEETIFAGEFYRAGSITK